MTPLNRQLLVDWKHRAEKEPDAFVRFFILYMCLDAWMSTKSGARNDAGKKTWLKDETNPFRSHWLSSAPNQEPLRELVEIGKVYNMAPWVKRQTYKEFTSTENFDELVEFIYQIRCNLFHGGKSPTSDEDERRVTLAAEVLADWIPWIISQPE